MRIRRCCKICFVVQLISFSTLVCGAIAIWGAIELSQQNWDQASIFVKFSCIAAGCIFFNIAITGTFYCIVWRRAVRKEAMTSIQMAERPVYLSRDSVSTTNLWTSEESTSEVGSLPPMARRTISVDSFEVSESTSLDILPRYVEGVAGSVSPRRNTSPVPVNREVAEDVVLPTPKSPRIRALSNSAKVELTPSQRRKIMGEPVSIITTNKQSKRRSHLSPDTPRPSEDESSSE